MKILLSAFACQPNRGSEHGLGWNWVRALSRDHSVWVLTDQLNAPAISAAGEIPNVRFEFVACPLQRLRTRPVLAWIWRYLWQYAAYRRAVQLHREIRFDIVHHVTVGTWRLPSLLSRLDAPFIWGPVGGGQDIPRGFRGTLGVVGRRLELARSISQLMSRYDPLIRDTLTRATVVIAANTPTRKVLESMGRHDVRQILETAIEPAALRLPTQPRAGRPLHVFWVGEFHPRKALPLLLEAVQILQDRVALAVTVVGEGRERQRWERISRRLGVSGHVTFLGRVPHREVLSLYADADVFVFTSIRDTSGNVLLEAMAAGVPVVTLAWAGAPEIVSPDCGILIPPSSPEQVVRDLAAALERLAADPDLRQRLGEAAQRRIRKLFTWERLTERMNALYREIRSASQTGAGDTAP